MIIHALRLLAALILPWATGAAQAAINCTAPTSTGFTTAYDTAGTINNVTQGTVTFSCTRGAAGDPTTVLLRANNGNNALGVQNRARRAVGSLLNYEAYKDSACTSVWTSLITADFMTITLTAAPGVPEPISVNFWGCVPPGQAAANGTYTDTVTMRVRNNTDTGNLSPNGSFNVSITVPATCTVPAALTALAFPAYTAFQGTEATGSTTLTLTCTNNLPYQMTLDSYVAVFAGNNLQYTLNINGESPPVNKRGSGVAQNWPINGKIPAGQAGKCASGSCPASAPHTITVTW